MLGSSCFFDRSIKHSQHEPTKTICVRDSPCLYVTRRKGVYGNRRIWERVEKWDKKLNPKDFAVYLDQTKPLARELFTEYQGVQETIMKMVKPIVDRYGSEFARFQAYMWYAMQCWYIKQRYKDEALKKMTNALYIYWTIAGLKEEVLREIACMLSTCPDSLDVIVQNYLHVTVGKPVMSINYNELEQVITKAIIDALVQEKLTDIYDNVYNAIKNNPLLQQLLQYIFDINIRKNLGQIITYINYSSDEWKHFIKISGNYTSFQVVDNNITTVLNSDDVPYNIINNLFRCLLFPSSCSKLLEIEIPAYGSCIVEVSVPAGFADQSILVTGVAITNNNVFIEYTSPRLCGREVEPYTFIYDLATMYNYFSTSSQFTLFLAYGILPIVVIDSTCFIRIINNESSSVKIYLLPVTVIPLNYVLCKKVPIVTRLFAIDNNTVNYLPAQAYSGFEILDLNELLSFSYKKCALFRLSVLYVCNNLSTANINIQYMESTVPLYVLTNLSTYTCVEGLAGLSCSVYLRDVPFKVYYEYGCTSFGSGIFVTASSSESSWFIYGASTLEYVSDTSENTWTETVNISTTINPFTSYSTPIIYPAMNNYVGVRHIKSASLSITAGSYNVNVLAQFPAVRDNTSVIKIATVQANSTQTVNIDRRCMAIYVVPEYEETVTISGTVEWSDTLLL